MDLLAHFIQLIHLLIHAYEWGGVTVGKMPVIFKNSKKKRFYSKNGVSEMAQSDVLQVHE